MYFNSTYVWQLSGLSGCLGYQIIVEKFGE